MNYECPNCRTLFFINKETTTLIIGFFSRVLDRKTISLLCDKCGDMILRNYRDTYGIGV